MSFYNLFTTKIGCGVMVTHNPSYKEVKEVGPPYKEVGPPPRLTNWAIAAWGS